MRYTYEFEILPGEHGYHAVIPFDFEGSTQGEGVADAINMAADWLQVMVEHALMHRLDLPAPTYGNEPRHGGRVVNVSVEVSLDTVRAVRASEAAERLDAGDKEGDRGTVRLSQSVLSPSPRLSVPPFGQSPGSVPSVG